MIWVTSKCSCSQIWLADDITLWKTEDKRSSPNDYSFITFESVTALDRKFIDSEKNTLAKREINDENEVNEINFFER